MMEKFFNILLLGDRRIQTCLNALIYVANPTEKEQAHITFQGPFFRVSEAQKSASSLVGDVGTIEFDGVGSFLNDRQSTVFLKVSSRFVKNNWKKAAGFDTPHLTIFDGKSRRFAEAVLAALSRFRLQFSVPGGAVETIQSISGQSRLFLALNIDRTEFEAVSGDSFPDFSERLTQEWYRLMMIERLCSRVENIAHELWIDRFRRPLRASGGIAK